MQKILVCGGRPLCGRIRVSGSKNAALPIIFATLITSGISHLENVPDIGDVQVAIELIEKLGARVSREKSTLTVDTRELSFCDPPVSLTSSIRASTYLLGAMLSRFGLFHTGEFGGCNFSPRPIDMHIDAARAFGASYDGRTLFANRLHGAEIHFSKVSVGATANALIMAFSAEGESVIYGGAREPHILNLIDYLRSTGAKIDIYEDRITVLRGKLGGGDVRIIGDMIEAGTYLSAGLMTDGEVTVEGFCPDELSPFTTALISLGALVRAQADSISVASGDRYRFTSVIAEPYPAFPTDLQPIVAPLMARRLGGLIVDRVWRERFGYLDSLRLFGVISHAHDGYALIEGSSLHPARTSATDLRGGAAALITALAADGESEIDNAKIIHRGYESLEEKLAQLGAKIKII